MFIYLLLQGQVTSEQQFSFVPRQPQPQPPTPNRFNPGPAGFVSPSARPQVGGGSQDNVPTVPAVTNFQRFRPSEASDVETNLRFQPSPRPAFEQQPAQANPGIFPPQAPQAPQAFPNSHSNTLRTPTFTVPPSLSIEPISSQGVISRPSLVAQESETTGTAFRGRQRLRVRPDQVDTGSGTRTRLRTKVRFGGEEEVEAAELETEAPPATTAARGGRTRSRFSPSRARAPTGSRLVATGQRKRQRFNQNNNNNNNNKDLPEEDRRSGAAGSPRRKVNRVPNFTSRRKTTPPPEVPVTRIPARRRKKPINFDQDERAEVQTESPLSQFDSGVSTKSSEALLRELLSSSKESSSTLTDEGIEVLPASTVGNSHTLSPTLSSLEK